MMQETETLRAFVAIDIDEHVRAALARLQDRLKMEDVRVKWVEPRNIHLTLIFARAIPATTVNPLAAELDTIASQTRPFSYIVTKPGFFGARSSPRVIWAGIEANPVLAVMQRQVATSFRTIGIEFDDRPFSPHLTLGRIREPRNGRRLIEKLESYRKDAIGTVAVAELLLISSTLGPKGPVYSIRHRAGLETPVA